MKQPAAGWFNEVAAFLGPAYLRNAFTYGTEQEIDFLVEALDLDPGARILDAGCGPGRHSLALARRGFEVTGVDLSPEFLDVGHATAAREGLDVVFLLGDVRTLPFDAAFDAVICLCQGGFGLLGGGDEEAEALAQLVRAMHPGGRLALSAFSSYFAVRHLDAGETFNAASGVLHESATVRGPAGDERVFDLWTTCFTPRELRLMAVTAGLSVDGVYGVRPGEYARNAPTVDHPEHLLLARRAR